MHVSLCHAVQMKSPHCGALRAILPGWNRHKEAAKVTVDAMQGVLHSILLDMLQIDSYKTFH